MEKREIPHLTYAELSEKVTRLEDLFYAAYDALVEITGPQETSEYAAWTVRHDAILRLISTIKQAAIDHETHMAQRNMPAMTTDNTPLTVTV